ncbi:hypothetical protein B0A50_03664 [Salinomyces thailandicus]|uniref:DUF1760-domain-containing protein n=1 Tax=Salinomyces thailandicus TaxID=706561 RepID=A0A4U0U2Z8_9PEZI|nr:hypothetical protein B0A50_03664 [Salinomyces thailandica]
MAEQEHLLIAALPPNSDYYTYLTLIEYNLSPENIPILHKVLQDEKLTTNIGWDLVHLLVPFLPESEACLLDIARLGNPREVILKVTESLRLIEHEEDAVGLTDSMDALAGATTDSKEKAESSTYPLKSAPTASGASSSGSAQMVELPPPLPLGVSHFNALLSMLAILHPRIRTKAPSKFLSVTLQAILASFSGAQSHREEMVLAIVKCVKEMVGVKRPALPSRKSSGMLTSRSTASATRAPAADPEGTIESSADVDDGEREMQDRLLQSFVTHVVEEYLLGLPSDDDVPGMAWCSRIMEKLHSERTIPDKQTLAGRFQAEGRLQRRIDAVGQLVTLAQDLKLSDDTLLAAATTVEKVAAAGSATQDEDDPPDSAGDIPLSRIGSILIYTAKQVAGILYDSGKLSESQPFAIFPDHQELLKHCLASVDQGSGALGTEPEPLIDAVLALGHILLERNAMGEPATDEQFNEYLQVTALLSSNCPSPNLRGHAHYLTSTILRSHPDDNVKLAFIRDTLEHCPFENLKVSAVGWVKGETVEANPPTSPGTGGQGHQHGADVEETPKSVFATPLALDSLAPYLFPSLQAELVTAPLHDAWMNFQTNISFYLTSLNFLYLLLSARHLHQSLGIKDLWTNSDVAGSFLQPLRDAGKRFKEAMEDGGKLEEERTDELLAELGLLDETIERVTNAVRFLNET